MICIGVSNRIQSLDKLNNQTKDCFLVRLTAADGNGAKKSTGSNPLQGTTPYEEALLHALSDDDLT